MDWLPVGALAGVANISTRRARKLLEEVESGARTFWQGCALQVRTLHGRGGAAGLQYLVHRDSLPPDLQARWNTLQTPVEGASNPIPGRHTERSWWLHILGPALGTAKGSPERAAAFAAILAERHSDLYGRPIKLKLRQLQRRMQRMESAGSTGPLARLSRADKGKRRSFISREWDRRVRFSEKEKEAIARDLQSEIRSHVAAGAAWGQTIELCSRFLAKVSQRGFPITDAAELLRVCQVPKALVQAELHYRKLDQHRTDRKAIEDSRPRIKRKMDGLRPMELVVMDVHPLDVAVMRADGSEAHPRLLAFLDLATQRCWSELIFLDKRGGVRNVDLIEAFVAMAADAAFGVPQQVYCDNGSEYRFAAFLDDAMQLAWPGSSRRLRVINALPHNAPAKPVEQWFARFESQHLKHIPGYRGGNRMNNRQEAVGRKTAAFALGFEAFHEAFFGQLQAYETMPQKRGQIGAMSPRQAFARHVTDGWTAVVMDPENLLTAFTRPDERIVMQGVISVNGRRWTCPELQAFQGSRVRVHVPAYHGFNELLVETTAGERLGIARPDVEFAYLDQRGAQASAERTKRHNAGRRALAKDLRKIDMAAELAAIGAAAEPVIPNIPRDVVRIGRPDAHPRMIAPRGDPEAEAEARRRERLEIDEVRALAVMNAKKREA